MIVVFKYMILIQMDIYINLSIYENKFIKYMFDLNL